MIENINKTNPSINNPNITQDQTLADQMEAEIDQMEAAIDQMLLAFQQMGTLFALDPKTKARFEEEQNDLLERAQKIKALLEAIKGMLKGGLKTPEGELATLKSLMGLIDQAGAEIEGIAHEMERFLDELAKEAILKNGHIPEPLKRILLAFEKQGAQTKAICTERAEDLKRITQQSLEKALKQLKISHLNTIDAQAAAPIKH